MKVLTFAIHPPPLGYIGGGWIRMIELIKKSKSMGICYVLIEPNPTFQSLYGTRILNYETVAIRYLGSNSILGSLLMMINALIVGVSRCKKRDIDLILSPVEAWFNTIPAYLTAKLINIPWTATPQVLPGFIVPNGEAEKYTSSLRSIYQFIRFRKCRSMFWSIFSALINHLTYRALESTKVVGIGGMVKHLKEVNGRIDILEVVPANGIPLEEISRIPERPKVYDACFAAILVPEKGIFDLIRAWSIVTKRRKDALVAIIGKADSLTAKKLRTLIRKLNLEKNIVFPFDMSTGARTREQVWEVIKSSKLLVHPSTQDTWALIIGEALALGVPVMTYETYGIRYAYGSCPAVIFVPTKNIEVLSSKILQLLAHEKRRFQLSKIALSCSRKYKWKDVLKAEKLVYEKILNMEKLRANDW